MWLRRQVDLLLLIFCLALSLGIWVYGTKTDQTSQIYLVEERDRVQRELEIYLDQIGTYGSALTGLFEVTEKVSDKEFADFVVKVVGDKKNSGLFGFGYSKIETESGGKKSLVDKQMFFMDNRKYLDETQFKSYERLLSKTVSETSRENTPPAVVWLDNSVGVMMFPVKSEKSEIRQVSLLISAIQIQEEIDKLVSDDIAWEWWVSDQSVIAKGGTEVKKQKLSDQVKVNLPDGSTWGVDLLTTRKISSYWSLGLGVGIFVSFLIFAIVYALSTSGSRAEVLASQMTSELGKFKLALDSTSSHVIITDVNGAVLYANDSVSRLTGFTREEIIGSNPSLWGGQMGKEFYEKMWKTIKVDKKVFRGEVTNKRKSGETYLAQATISPIVDEKSGGLVGFVGIEEDITKRKKDESELRRMNELMIGRELKMAELKKKLREMV